MKDAKCELCGEPMPEGEQMFKFHGYSGPCPKPPLKPSIEEAGWVIVRHVMGELRYWTGEFVDDRAFLPDNQKAIRFAREQDGYHVLSWLLGGIGKVEEHMWVSP